MIMDRPPHNGHTHVLRLALLGTLMVSIVTGLVPRGLLALNGDNCDEFNSDSTDGLSSDTGDLLSTRTLLLGTGDLLLGTGVLLLGTGNLLLGEEELVSEEILLSDWLVLEYCTLP